MRDNFFLRHLAISKRGENISTNTYSAHRQSEVLEIILKRLGLPDHIRVGAVCSAWRSIVKKCRYAPMLQLPWLMIRDANMSSLKFYSLSENRTYALEVPGGGPIVCLTGYEGWIFIQRLKLLASATFLLNPVSGSRISLPTLTARIHYVALSSSPTDIGDVSASSFVIAGVCNTGEVAFCRPGDSRWSFLVIEGTRFMTTVFLNGSLHGLDTSRGLWRFESLGGQGQRATRMNIHPPVDRNPNDFLHGGFNFLTVLAGDLLVVSEIKESIVDDHHNPQSVTRGFEIFRLDSNISRWVKMYKLNDHLLFMCYGTMISLSSLEVLGFRCNCIYFIDQNPIADSPRLSVFDLEDSSIKPYASSGDTHSTTFLPVWIVASK